MRERVEGLIPAGFSLVQPDFVEAVVRYLDLPLVVGRAASNETLSY
jgi:hypothetical protein